MKYIKTYEKLNKPKFKIGDYVYLWNYAKTEIDETKKYKILNINDHGLSPSPTSIGYDKGYFYYKLEGLSHIDVREDLLVPDYEIDAKKYNL